jgi:hypothetical protein
VAKVEWILGPFSIWCRCRWGCDGWFRYRDTCSTKVSVCMGLGLAPGRGSKLRPIGCTRGDLSLNVFGLLSCEGPP